MKTNDAWIDNCYLNFQECLETGRGELAEACIEDAKERGFLHEASVMAAELKHWRTQEEKQEML